MGFVTVWAWESVMQDDCYEIVLGSHNPERPFNNAERRVLAGHAASLAQKIERMKPTMCKHELWVELYDRRARNWFRKRTWTQCITCDQVIEE